MNKLAAIILSLSVIFSPLPSKTGQVDTTGSGNSQVLKVLLSKFREHNPKIGFVELYDIRPLFLNPINFWPKPNHYLVLARGVRPDFKFEGSFEDELFGLFVVNNSLSTVDRTVEIIPSQRWCDYMIKIVKVWKDSVTIHGEGIAYGDQKMDKRFYLLK